MGFFDIIKKGLKKTQQLLNTDIRDLFKSEGRLIDDEFLEELFVKLIRTDMGIAAANKMVDDIRVNYRGRVVQMTDIVEHIKKGLKELMRQPESPIAFAEKGPTVIMFCGVNGCGKTTSIAKLTYMLRQQGKSVLLGAADTFRAAAVEQLTVWAQRLGAEIITGAPNSDPASVAYPLWVGGVQVTREKKSGHNWSYNPDTKTLRLNGGIDGSGEFTVGGTTFDCGIYSKIPDLTINVTTDSKVKGSDNRACSYGIMAAGCNLTITGDNELEVNNVDYGSF